MNIKIKVKPDSAQSSLTKLSDSEYLASIKAPREKGKANLELTKLLSKEFQVPASKIRIKNKLSRTKIIEILE